MRRRRSLVRIGVLCALTAVRLAPLHAQASWISDAAVAKIDSQLVRGLDRYKIAGAAIAIVDHGVVRHTRGFGTADIARRAPVDPASTRFHIASVTKVLTAIGALQQVERGRLTLDGDIRGMVPEVAPRGWATAPITLHQLLTHTAGLDPALIDLAARGPDSVGTLSSFLKQRTPPVVDVPGRAIRYSNFGYGIVGRAVERASGTTWAQWTATHVLNPLHMDSAYADARAPNASHAIGYRYRRDTTPEPFVFERLPPSGAVHATIVDLANLMIGILDTTSATTFLSAEHRRQLLVPREQIAPGVAGFAYGTFTYPSSRAAAVSVGGEVPGFSTRVLMIPDAQIGVAIAVNRKDPTLALAIFDSLLALAPVASARESCAPTSIAAAVEIPAGDYRTIAFDHHTFLHIGALIFPPLRVSRRAGDTLVVRDPVAARTDTWIPVGRNAWRTLDGRCLGAIAGGNGSSGRIALSTAQAGPVMLEPIPMLALPMWSVVGILIAIVLLIVGAIAGIGVSSTVMSWTTPILAIGNIVFLIGFLVGLTRLAITYDDRFAFGLPFAFTLVLALPYVLLAVTAVHLFALRTQGGGPLRGRIAGVLAALGSATVLMIAWGWSIPLS